MLIILLGHLSMLPINKPLHTGKKNDIRVQAAYMVFLANTVTLNEILKRQRTISMPPQTTCFDPKNHMHSMDSPSHKTKYHH